MAPGRAVLVLLATPAAAVAGLADAASLAQRQAAVQRGELWRSFRSADAVVGNSSVGEKSLLYFLHFAGTAGTSVCDFAKRCSEKTGTGVTLNFVQTAGNCNFYGTNPANPKAHNPKLATCSGLLEHASSGSSRSTWGFAQTTLDVTPPCPKVSFLTVFREPWTRMRSHLMKHAADQWPPDAVHQAREVYRKMGAGGSKEEGEELTAGKHFPSNGLGIVYLDNYHIRTLLGEEEGKRLPWGSLDEVHLQRAKAKLEAFDLVMPVEALSDGVPSMQCAAGVGFDLSKCGLSSLPRENDHSYLMRTKPPAPELYQVEKLFRAQNKLDLQLYDWVVERWNSRQSPCSSAATAEPKSLAARRGTV